MASTKKIVFFLGMLAGSAAFLVFLAYLFGWATRAGQGAPPDYPPEEVAAVEAARVGALDPKAEPLVLHMAVDYSRGDAAPWYPKGESPILAELVAEGKLPPVAERVGPEPVVMRGVDGIGTYGGTWRRIVTAEGAIGFDLHILTPNTPVRWSPTGYPLKPHLFKGWEASDDFREYTVHLRRGVRWSDGHPFTARDVMYWWESEQVIYDEYPEFMYVAGTRGDIEKSDDYTLVFRFDEPYGLFPEVLTQVIFYNPEHYLRPYHPELGDPEKVAAMMAAQGVADARSSYTRLKTWRNPEFPSLSPWILRAYQRSAPYVFVRNPYYWVVDVEGNQLPYIDRVVWQVRSPDTLALSVAAGDVSMQSRDIDFDSHSLYMSSRESGDFEVYYWLSAERSNFAVFPNINRRIDPDRPATRWKHELLADKRFRQALSLAINRKDIVRAAWSDLVEPAQLDPGRESPFHHPELFQAFTAHDPGAAGRLLDGIGLVGRDVEGYRTFPDGTRMTFFLHVSDDTGVGPSQFLIDDWRAVGVRVILKLSAFSFWQLEQDALEHDLTVWQGASEFFPLIEPRSFVPVSRHSFHAPGFADWYRYGGLYGSDRVAGRAKAIEPPPEHPARRAMDVLEAARREGDPDRQRAVFREVLDIAAEQLWSINIATPTPKLAVVRNGFRNVPLRALHGWALRSPGNLGQETYFFEAPTDSPDAVTSVKHAMATVAPDPTRTLRPDAAYPEAPRPAAGILGGVLRFLIVGVAFLAVLLAMVRHPFIVRRLVILLPTLFIISVAVFTIIQLPPGDYITARIMELEMQGDTAAIHQMEELRSLFHLEETPAKRYVRWMGLPWFLTFDAADRGLLQGDLGRSMEDTRRVGDIVGDRIVLTVLISFLTILFTWLVAIPIGLYSAVRQYSIGDYVFTLLGFIGMCVPGMLLALLLMYIGSAWFGMPVGGLFSPEYALQPEWTWGKVVDLMRHIWIPVLVVGLAGTAGMIRVLRANLLDELEKPYVTTARAKGVRPLKLLLKYPLRLALNPFISGIGHIFPALVSGSAIVAIVLSLPTVGPLLLSALQAQDMYMAGSMLMVLSLLTVFGTLVSDLLLMWVDPRIRMTGGET